MISNGVDGVKLVLAALKDLQSKEVVFVSRFAAREAGKLVRDEVKPKLPVRTGNLKKVYKVMMLRKPVKQEQEAIVKFYVKKKKKKVVPELTEDEKKQIEVQKKTLSDIRKAINKAKRAELEAQRKEGKIPPKKKRRRGPKKKASRPVPRDPFYWKFQEFGYSQRNKVGVRGKRIISNTFLNLENSGRLTKAYEESFDKGLMLLAKKALNSRGQITKEARAAGIS